jgi:hypothetical protein
MLALYRRLIRLYPAAYVREYGDEMVYVFRQAQDAARQQSLQRRAQFWMRELCGVLTGAYRAQWRHFPRSLFRRFDMQSDFRFPRPAVAAMTALLAFVLYAIEKTRHLASTAPGAFDPLWSPWTVLARLAYAVFVACFFGSIGYGVILALRKAGIRK